MAIVRFSNKISAVISSVAILFLKKWRRESCKLNTVEQFGTLTNYYKRTRNDTNWLSKMYILNECVVQEDCKIQGDSVARGPKLLPIKNYVIEITTWTFIYTYRERCKTGPAHNRCWNWSPFTSKHTWMRFSKFLNTFQICLRSLARESPCILEAWEWIWD